MPYDAYLDGILDRSLLIGRDALGNYRIVQVDASGALKPTVASSTAVVTRVATTSDNSVTLLTASAARTGAILVNESSNTMFLKYGATATLSDYTYRLAANDTLEIGFGWTGRIDAILEPGAMIASAGFAQI